MRVAAYARVSTHDQKILGLQTDSRITYIKQRGWDVAKQIRDVGSGVTDREGRESLLRAARRREFDRILVWRLDRWGRSVADLMTTLRELDGLGIGLSR